VIAASLASGLLSLALEAGLLLLCSRWVRAVSAGAALVLILVPFLVTGPAVLKGGVVAPIDLIYGSEPWRSAADERGIDEIHNPILSDVIHQILPWQAAVRHAYRAGEWPLLNPFILGGDPLAASAQPAPLYFLIAWTYALSAGYALGLRLTGRAPWLVDIQLALDVLTAAAFVWDGGEELRDADLGGFGLQLGHKDSIRGHGSMMPGVGEG